MIDSGDFNFSFSGLKTALIYKVGDDPNLRKEDKVKDLVASFLKAMVDVLVAKSVAAAREYGLSQIALAGGVAANSLLRLEMKRAAEVEGMAFFCPGLLYCTDNAAMIACRAFDLAGEIQEQEKQRNMSLDVFSTLRIPQKRLR
jgi:N6-L-threonylcarbamoyladenine synthase